jgi:hypothetical protein
LPRTISGARNRASCDVSVWLLSNSQSKWGSSTTMAMGAASQQAAGFIPARACLLIAVNSASTPSSNSPA